MKPFIQAAIDGNTNAIISMLGSGTNINLPEPLSYFY